MFGRKGGVGRMSHYRLIYRHLLIFRDQNEHSMLVKNKQANFTFVLCFIHQARHLSKTLCKQGLAPVPRAPHLRSAQDRSDSQWRLELICEGPGRSKACWERGQHRAGAVLAGRPEEKRTTLGSLRPVGARQSQGQGSQLRLRGGQATLSRRRGH